jgi:hypothetical protein
MKMKREIRQGIPCFTVVPVPHYGNSQSREEDEIGFEEVTAEGTGWINDIRNYDCPICRTTTFTFSY